MKGIVLRQTPLLQSVRRYNEKVVDLLLNRGENANDKNSLDQMSVIEISMGLGGN